MTTVARCGPVSKSSHKLAATGSPRASNNV